VVAVANRSQASSESVADEFDIPFAFGDYRDVLSRDDVNAVIVGTQPYFHHEAVIAALDAGKHVLCQTRMATSLREAREMLSKVQQTGLRAMLIRAAAYSRAHRYVGQIIHSGEIGRVRQVYAYYFRSNYVDGAAPLHERQDHRNFGVINPMALGIYWDVLRPWFGDPERVLAWGKVFTGSRADGPGGPPITIEMPDAITVVAEMPNGMVITCVLSGVAHFGDERIEFYGEDGTLVYPARGSLLMGRKGDKELAPLTVPADQEESLTIEEDFVRLVRGDVAEAGFSFDDGLKNIEFLEASHQSLVEGRWVTLPLP
jgi:predicted dehydrogenase